MKTVEASPKIGIIAGVGDRRDSDLVGVGEEAAKIFDEIIIKLDEDLRGRSGDEIFGLVMAGIRRYSPDKKIALNPNECDAVEMAIKSASPGAFITVLTDNISKVTSFIKDLQNKVPTQTAETMIAV